MYGKMRVPGGRTHNGQHFFVERWTLLTLNDRHLCNVSEATQTSSDCCCRGKHSTNNKKLNSFFSGFNKHTNILVWKRSYR